MDTPTDIFLYLLLFSLTLLFWRGNGYFYRELGYINITNNSPFILLPGHLF